MAKLLLLLTVLPLLELAVLLLIGKYTSVSFTLALVLLAGLAGTILLRYQGWQTYRNIQRDLNEQRMPTTSLIDALMIFLAGVLLILPGVLTDLVAISLLVPACRRAYRALFAAWLKAKFSVDSSGSTSEAAASGKRIARGEVLDSYVVERHDSPDSGRGENREKPSGGA